MQIVAITNQKGGTGKTTTAVTLAHDLAQRGHVTALVDCDAQGNASACLGLTPEPGLYHAMMGLMALGDVLREARPNLWLLPGDKDTAKLKTALAGEPYRETLLARLLAGLEAEYCIIDTGPSRDLLHDMIHHAADSVIIPAAVDALAIAGVFQELDTLQTVREHGHAITCLAIVPQFWERVTRESDTNLRELVSQFGDLVLPAIPRTTKLREAPAYGQTAWEYLPANHPALRSYTRLTERVLNHAK